MPLLEISKLVKTFIRPDGSEHTVVNLDSFRLDDKMQMALKGESGSGKTTLLHLIAGILKPDSGSIVIAGQKMSVLSEPERDRLRATTIGYIFQAFNLMQGYTCVENVLLGMSFGSKVDHAFAKALLLLKRVGLENHLTHLPRQLSTGQQQRLAVARALANDPKLILADEPTGNLDDKNAQRSLTLIRETCRENGAALLLVTHDRDVISQFENVQEFAGINQTSLEETTS
jgi:ABC-type lipoprotein export system ATPase subunit